MNRKFEIFHVKSDSFFKTCCWESRAKANINPEDGLHWNCDYEMVATIETRQLDAENLMDILERVYHDTNHIDSDWTKNPRVVKIADQVRSTSVGDIIVDSHSKEMFIVGGIGFYRVKTSSMNPIVDCEVI